MKKFAAYSVVSAMLFTMGTNAFADIASGEVGEEKAVWPNEFAFADSVQVIRNDENLEFDLSESNEIALEPGDELYFPLYYTTKEGESITVGASKEEMTGHVPYTGEADKKWKLNLVEKSRNLVESADFYKAQSQDKNLVKGALYVKVQTKNEYNSLEDLEYEMSLAVSERYSQNKTEAVEIEGVFSNPKAENPVNFDWENSVFKKEVWEVNKEEDGQATFNFNDDAYFTVKMFGGDKVMFDFDRNYNKEIASRYDEDLYFYNFRGNLDSFSATGTLTIPVEEPMYLYEVGSNNSLKATSAVYNEETEAMELKTKSLGEYVLTPKQLDVSQQETENNKPQEEEKPQTEIPSYGENQEQQDYLSGGKDNPDTGAKDMVSLAVSAAAVSLLCGAALSKKIK